MTDCVYRTQERTRRISLAAQWPRLHAANAGGAGWVLGQGSGSHVRACKVTLVVSHSLWHYGLFQAPVHGILQVRIQEWVAILVFLLQGILPTQGSNLCLLHWQAGSLPLCPNMLGKPQHAATKTCHSQINKQIINREREKEEDIHPRINWSSYALFLPLSTSGAPLTHLRSDVFYHPLMSLKALKPNA